MSLSFFVLGSNRSDNKFGVDKSTAVPVSSTCCWGSPYPWHCSQGCLCWMNPTVLPSSHPILTKHKAKDLRHLQPTPVAAGLPWQGQGTHGNHCTGLGVLTIKWFVWRWGSFPVQVKYFPGRTLQAKIYGGKREVSGLALRPDMIFQKCCGFNSSVSSWGSTERSALLKTHIICLGS